MKRSLPVDALGEQRRGGRVGDVDDRERILRNGQHECGVADDSNFLSELKSDGFLFAIDDFGSGFSSFQYIKHFPIDFLKIEGDFITHMLDDRRDMAFVKSISTLAAELGIRTVAEKADSRSLREALAKMGIDYAKGALNEDPRRVSMYSEQQWI